LLSCLEIEVVGLGFRLMRQTLAPAAGATPWTRALEGTRLKNSKPTSASCSHPLKARVYEESELICSDCGQVIQEATKHTASSEKYGRGPENAIVFRKNLGATSRTPGRKGPEPVHLHAVKSLYGGNGSLGSLNLMKTCPTCKAQQPVSIFSDDRLFCENESCGVLQCSKCGEHGEISEENGDLRCSSGAFVSEDLACDKHGDVRKNVKFIRTRLGEYVLRWNPSNNGNSHALSFWADVRLLQTWDGPEDDPVLRLGRQILSEKLLGHVKDEEAHFLAQKCLLALKELSKVTRRQVNRLITSILDAEEILA
jgi:hypothetical protein